MENPQGGIFEDLGGFELLVVLEAHPEVFDEILIEPALGSDFDQLPGKFFEQLGLLQGNLLLEV